MRKPKAPRVAGRRGVGWLLGLVDALEFLFGRRIAEPGGMFDHGDAAPGGAHLEWGPVSAGRRGKVRRVVWVTRA